MKYTNFRNYHSSCFQSKATNGAVLIVKFFYDALKYLGADIMGKKASRFSVVVHLTTSNVADGIQRRQYLRLVDLQFDFEQVFNNLISSIASAQFIGCELFNEAID